MKRYKCLLFDFDRTLWDVETNQKAAQRVIYEKYELARYAPDFETYYGVYLGISDRLWIEYRDGLIGREYLRNHRFVELMENFGMTDQSFARELSDEYIRIAPSFSSTIPHAREVVESLAKQYPMYLVTNGFNEVQHLKLRNCGLDPYFGAIFTSEDAGANKPDPRIFNYALQHAGVTADEALMIGDDLETDIAGAVRAGIDTVFFNPHYTKHTMNPTHEIQRLPELLAFL